MERRNGRIQCIDTVFYPSDVFGTKAAGFSELCEGRVGGEVGADDKEFILNEEEQGIVFGPISCLSKESYVGIEFIDGSIGLGSFLVVRCPPTNDVVPLSPVIVYRLLFFISLFLGINGYIVREVRNRFWHLVRCGKDPDGRIARNFLCAAVLFAESMR